MEKSAIFVRLKLISISASSRPSAIEQGTWSRATLIAQDSASGPSVRLQVISQTRGTAIRRQKQEIPFPGVFNWAWIWQFGQLWHLFDMLFMFIKPVNDDARPADDSAVIPCESACFWERKKKKKTAKTYYRARVIIIQPFLPCPRRG